MTDTPPQPQDEPQPDLQQTSGNLHLLEADFTRNPSEFNQAAQVIPAHDQIRQDILRVQADIQQVRGDLSGIRDELLAFSLK